MLSDFPDVGHLTSTHSSNPTSTVTYPLTMLNRDRKSGNIGGFGRGIQARVGCAPAWLLVLPVAADLVLKAAPVRPHLPLSRPVHRMPRRSF